MKYIFVTGGVVSGLGKGICAASLGRLLKQCGLRVRNQKFDPYFNVDPGTMSPYQHGRYSSPMTGRKPTSTWDITSASWMNRWTGTPRYPPARFFGAC